MTTLLGVNAPSTSVRGAPSLWTIVELLKPVTWFPPMWAFACGVVSTGLPVRDRLGTVALGVLITGPLVCATSQAANDWFDRHVDAINEPHRPIPSGRMPGTWGLRIAIVWTLLSLAAAIPLGASGMLAVGIALAFAWAYSAPPLRFKQNGWIGNAAVGITYEGLAWVTGAVVMLGGLVPDGRVLAIAALYSLGAHGILTLNDFKAIDGDRRMGIRSLPATLGPTRAAWVLCVVMLVPQLVVIGLLRAWGATGAPIGITALVAVQLGLMARFLAAPRERALFLSAVGVPFYVSGMMVAAVALRSLA
ncbi:MAG: chlorophyll synthase ChlG [Gemmatimonadota bacterium]|nr:chlorophyll synthase ChlG [Gemmatimonadota bacterium]MDQ8147197.1 chlorophyll synthase ChlG [Gemmatimonadota bacterium]MDQ8149051.1 chlorophyll synthase ChlG [Gemmatimonadota bacterium]MDQ8156355.1 chlorophyll synthase ChlG [Gemmatimonadota bacterium]MDQ8176612.1 chlorophyll synthase ChlG [Gemmatimonadota bacterium]